MKDRLNIVFISSWFPNKKNRFLGDFIIRHAEAISFKNKVTFIYHSDIDIVELNQLSVPKEVSFIRIPTPVSFPLLKNLILIYHYIVILRKINKENKIDIIHANISYPSGIYAYILSRLFQVPYIITEHWTGYLPERNARLSFLKKWITGFGTQKASAICPVTNNLGNAMQNMGLTGNYIKVDNVVNTFIFKPSNNQKTEYDFIHISSLDNEQKNISGILTVFKKLTIKYPKSKMLIVGSDNIDETKRMISEMKMEKSIILEVCLNQSEIADRLTKSGSLVIFSRYENMPCVIAEALVCGIPVISTNVGGIAEHINGKTGKLIKSENEGDLYNSMLEIIENNQFNKNTISEYGFKHFSPEAVSNSYNQVYRLALVKYDYKSK